MSAAEDLEFLGDVGDPEDRPKRGRKTAAPKQEPENYLLDAQGLTKTYRRRRVVDRVSVHVQPGEIVSLLGPNGAGKTTTFRMIVGMVSPDSGTVAFGGKDVTKMPMYRRARRGLGYLSQEPSVFRRMKAIDNVLAVLEARRVPRADRMKRAELLLDELNLTHLRDSYGETLSGGERRRLEISPALATEPSLLLLDEPFAGVDPITVEEIQKILRTLTARGIAILITDHDVRATLPLSDRAYILAQGKVIAEGDPTSIIENPVVRKVYLGSSFGEGVTQEEREGLGDLDL
jgi:lipopolysaccharide export system ATP-binding protein